MPPHCDTMDGPVVKAAARALKEEDVDVVLPYVPRDGEEEVRRCFASVVELRGQGARGRELADRHFFETGSADELVGVLCDTVAERARTQLQTVRELRDQANGDLEANRRYVSAMLGLQVWAHGLYECAQSAPHEAEHHTRHRQGQRR